jgi:hypothetical protein
MPGLDMMRIFKAHVDIQAREYPDIPEASRDGMAEGVSRPTGGRSRMAGRKGIIMPEKT